MILPCISLWQPWAWLLFTPHKIHETRSWMAPRRYVGRRIAIHAAKKKVSPLEVDARIQSAIAEAGAEFFYGGIIGTALLNYSYPMTHVEPAGEMDEVCGLWGPGRFAWRMEDAKLLDQPIPLKGQQGFWSVEIPDGQG